ELWLDGPGYSVGGVFLVSAGAVLNLNGELTFTGTYTGSGAGHVQLTGALTASDAVLDFEPEVFQWVGGYLAGPVTNVGALSIVGNGIHYLLGALNNAGSIVQKDDGRVNFRSGVLNNLTGAVYDLAGDGDFRWESGTRGVINNDGVFRKSAGTGVSTMSGGGSAISFNNGAGGVIDVQSGELRLDGPGSSEGGTFLVALNAVLNLNGDFEFSGTYTG